MHCCSFLSFFFAINIRGALKWLRRQTFALKTKMRSCHSRANVETMASERGNAPLAGGGEESAEFWCKPLALVARIRLGVAKVIFPYLHRY